jgi:hypothetical protein
MKKHSKTIKLFLIDGDANGRLSCELSNWTGKAYKIPRTKIKDCSDRDDMKNTGIYLLFGRNELSKELVYIGEAETILTRLMQHLKAKDFWNEAIVFISKDENLNKAHIKYLENRMFELVKTANRYQLLNSITPTQSSISESDRAEMEEFLENIKMLVNTLGHKCFDNKRETLIESTFTPETKNAVFTNNIFKIDGPRGANAYGKPTSDGFVVLKDSKIAGEIVNSFAQSFNNLRNKLIEDGIIKIENEIYYFPDDYIFSSPSSAASVVMGRTANGLIEWKLSDGTTLKDYEQSI